jgi:uncharacterized protein
VRPLAPLAVALALGAAGCSATGDAGSSETSTRSLPATSVVPTTGASVAPPALTSTPAASLVPEGFEAVSVEVLGAGVLRQLCVWLAASPDQRQQGLMGVTSLGGADGMLFDFGGQGIGQFWMYRTLLPLSIAFYDADGAYVSAADMEPCPAADGAQCPRYGAGGPYTYAVEVEQGMLPDLGLVPGSRLEIGTTCRPS